MMSSWEQAGLPNPGSEEAWKRGCMCPGMDNGWGRGFPLRGELQFWITVGCPLHAPVEDTAPL